MVCMLEAQQATKMYLCVAGAGDKLRLIAIGVAIIRKSSNGNSLGEKAFSAHWKSLDLEDDISKMPERRLHGIDAELCLGCP